MWSDTAGLPLGGGLLIAGLIYAGASLFITGQVVGERTIHQADWIPRCEKGIVAAVTRDAPVLQTPVKTPDCETIMGSFAGRDGRAMCGAFGFMFENPAAAHIEAQNRRLRQAQKARVKQAGSRCSCAVHVALEDRVPWAIHAGSFRLISPPPVRNFEAELSAALSSDTCKGEVQ